MANYSAITRWPVAAERNRSIDRLLDLREGLRRQVPAKQDGYMLLATWNLRDFDGGGFNPGRRLDESIFYIAEIISAFDLVAVQEVRRDMTGLRRLLTVLGHNWDYIVTDASEGAGGNDERMAFLFDRRKIRFRNVAGEVVLPEGQEIVAEGTARTGTPRRIQFARSPFVVAFQAGWFKFNLCTVHIYYGSDYGKKKQRRIDEIDRICAFFARRQEREAEDYILLGDFNIIAPDDDTMAPLHKHGYTIPEPLRSRPSNFGGGKFYDQIALRVRDKRLELDTADTFDFARHVFRPEDADAYLSYIDPDTVPHAAGKPAAEVYARWLTWQMSDHLPMWARFRVDWTDAYLTSLRPGQEPLV